MNYHATCEVDKSLAPAHDLEAAGELDESEEEKKKKKKKCPTFLLLPL